MCLQNELRKEGIKLDSNPGCLTVQATPGPFGLWIKDITCDKLDDKQAVLLVATNLRKQIVEAKYYDFLSEAFVR